MAADTRLDHRWIDLRTPANQAIFKIQSAVCKYFRDNLASKVRLCVDGKVFFFCITVKFMPYVVSSHSELCLDGPSYVVKVLKV